MTPSGRSGIAFSMRSGSATHRALGLGHGHHLRLRIGEESLNLDRLRSIGVASVEDGDGGCSHARPLSRAGHRTATRSQPLPGGLRRRSSRSYRVDPEANMGSTRPRRVPVTILLIIGGLIALLVGAEILVRAASSLAGRLGVPPMVIGLTVVSIGTSLPELAIGIDAARGGSPTLAVGNIVGANLINLLLVLGLAALLAPIAFERRTLRFELPAMVVAALALYVLARDGVLVRTDGILLIAGGLVYTAGVLYAGRRDTQPIAVDPTPQTPERSSGVLRMVVQLVVGLVAIV